MENVIIVDDVAYIKSALQPKNKLQALVLPAACWMNEHVKKDWCTGRTTGILIEFIGMAMQHPNKKFKISDITEKDHGTRVVHTHVLDQIEDLICKMELKFFTLNRTEKTLSYDVHFTKEK